MKSDPRPKEKKHVYCICTWNQKPSFFAHKMYYILFRLIVIKKEREEVTDNSIYFKFQEYIEAKHLWDILWKRPQNVIHYL